MSAEERALRKEAREKITEVEKAEYELKAAAKLATYKAGLPKRLMDAQARALKLFVRCDVGLTESGPEVSFYYNQGDDFVDITLSYNSDEWAVVFLEGKLRNLQDQVDLRAARRLIAQNIWTTLDQEQKSCLLEHIEYLK